MPGTTLSKRIHITGASGSRVTSLGVYLARTLDVPHLDTDDFYWQPTDPPFTEKRPVPERLALMRSDMGAGGWVISGSLDGWGDPLLGAADLIVFLTLARAERLARLIRRERERFGARIGPGGDMEQIHKAFLDWAVQYDEPGFTGRSRARHEAWLAELDMPVLRLDAHQTPEALARAVLAALG
jgi:adenylate kinase family enzyme